MDSRLAIKNCDKSIVGLLLACQKVEALYDSILSQNCSKILIMDGAIIPCASPPGWHEKSGYDWHIILTGLEINQYAKVIWEFSHELAHVHLDIGGSLASESFCNAMAFLTMFKLDEEWNDFGPKINYPPCQLSLGQYVIPYAKKDAIPGDANRSIEVWNGVKIYEYLSIDDSVGWETMKKLCAYSKDDHFITACKNLSPLLTDIEPYPL
ncbi:MAG: hypothetical protein ACYC27_21655 [Armatimonadota bacterium]